MPWLHAHWNGRLNGLLFQLRQMILSSHLLLSLDFLCNGNPCFNTGCFLKQVFWFIHAFPSKPSFNQGHRFNQSPLFNLNLHNFKHCLLPSSNSLLCRVFCLNVELFDQNLHVHSKSAFYIKVFRSIPFSWTAVLGIKVFSLNPDHRFNWSPLFNLNLHFQRLPSLKQDFF